METIVPMSSMPPAPSSSPRPRRQRRSWILWISGVGAVAAIAAIYIVRHHSGGGSIGSPPSGSAAVPSSSESGTGNSPTSTGGDIVVKTIHPKHNPHGFVRSVTQPAFVEGLFTADLMAHVAGTVKSIQKNIGDTIHEGEVLVELDVPELVQDLVQKTALVAQARQDAIAAAVAVEVAAASAKTAETLVRERQADEQHSMALRKFHEEEYARFKSLAEDKAVVGGVLDEKLRNLEAAIADYKSAQIATETARARAAEFSAKLAAARVDIEVKKARVAVAEADQARAQVMVDYAKIRAPFNGIIVARKVDPGSFVQNASTGNPTPMLRVVRTDWVTVVTWVPEKDSPWVTKNTEAIVRLDALGGREIHSKVTRFSHWLDPEKGRDMRVEVDIDNRDGLLSPGMYGTAKLILQRFDDAYLVPSGVVFAREGSYNTFIYEVRDGRAYRVPVRVQLEDGVEAKIAKLVRQTNPQTGQVEETTQPVTDKDEIVQNDQGELSDGQPVTTIPVSW